MLTRLGPGLNLKSRIYLEHTMRLFYCLGKVTKLKSIKIANEF
jgi:hypothetical protein